MDATHHTTLADGELAARFQRGDHMALETLVGRYRRFARGKSRGYFLVGGHADDLEQEALIGLFKAARDYQPDHDANFRTFALVCINRQLITAIRTATRPQQQPLNQYVSISERASGEQGAGAPEDLLCCRRDRDPVDTVLSSERMQTVRNSVTEMLSGFEADVLRLRVEGRSYQEISDQLGRHLKAIDNAVQRIKTKLDRYLHTTSRVEEDERETNPPAPADKA